MAKQVKLKTNNKLNARDLAKGSNYNFVQNSESKFRMKRESDGQVSVEPSLQVHPKIEATYLWYSVTSV